MKTTPNGVVEDGFTFGSPKIDPAYASADFQASFILQAYR